ncbi:hypothetical protein OKW21_004278 [Catalinimonas alkaloidigena]|uniref:hypothetical protein n=1 Tax=Catalinimonas alkaloidigena TaxID=1075417 RepID=UPI002404C6C5|nr:hypothetical protein [Catalinimonas alkaloidigena]MDF9799015.1 hypothetical protein [Catalinimonas alkaloidigena]
MTREKLSLFSSHSATELAERSRRGRLVCDDLPQGMSRSGAGFYRSHAATAGPYGQYPLPDEGR